MKICFKKSFFLFLILLLTLVFVSCAPSMNSIEQHLEELEMEDELSYQRMPKSQREEFTEKLEDRYDAKFDSMIVKAFVADSYNENRTDYKNVTVLEFEKSSDCKEAAKALNFALEGEELGENTVVIRKGKLLFFGNENMIDLILD